jgi:hypothetical protein
MQEPFPSPRRPAAIKTKLADGTIIYIQAQTFGGEPKPAAHLPSFDKVTRDISGIAKPLVHVLEETKPRKATLDFWVEIALETGQLAALLVKGTGETSLKITSELGE